MTSQTNHVGGSVEATITISAEWIVERLSLIADFVRWAFLLLTVGALVAWWTLVTVGLARLSLNETVWAKKWLRGTRVAEVFDRADTSHGSVVDIWCPLIRSLRAVVTLIAILIVITSSTELTWWAVFTAGCTSCGLIGR